MLQTRGSDATAPQTQKPGRPPRPGQRGQWSAQQKTGEPAPSAPDRQTRRAEAGAAPQAGDLANHVPCKRSRRGRMKERDGPTGRAKAGKPLETAQKSPTGGPEEVDQRISTTGTAATEQNSGRHSPAGARYRPRPGERRAGPSEEGRPKHSAKLVKRIRHQPGHLKNPKHTSPRTGGLRPPRAAARDGGRRAKGSAAPSRRREQQPHQSEQTQTPPAAHPSAARRKSGKDGQTHRRKHQGSNSTTPRRKPPTRKPDPKTRHTCRGGSSNPQEPGSSRKTEGHKDVTSWASGRQWWRVKRRKGATASGHSKGNSKPKGPKTCPRKGNTQNRRKRMRKEQETAKHQPPRRQYK